MIESYRIHSSHFLSHWPPFLAQEATGIKGFNTCRTRVLFVDVQRNPGTPAFSLPRGSVFPRAPALVGIRVEAQVGLDELAGLIIDGVAIILRKPQRRPRGGNLFGRISPAIFKAEQRVTAGPRCGSCVEAHKAHVKKLG